MLDLPGVYRACPEYFLSQWDRLKERTLVDFASESAEVYAYFHSLLKKVIAEYTIIFQRIYKYIKYLAV